MPKINQEDIRKVHKKINFNDLEWSEIDCRKPDNLNFSEWARAILLNVEAPEKKGRAKPMTEAQAKACTDVSMIRSSVNQIAKALNTLAKKPSINEKDRENIFRYIVAMQGANLTLDEIRKELV